MRSLYKSEFISQEVFRILNVIARNEKKKDSLRGKKILIRDRSSTIVTKFIGLTVAVYNGKRSITFKIMSKMVGHKFGEFAFTKIMGYDTHRTNKVTRKRAKKLLATRFAKKRKRTKSVSAKAKAKSQAKAKSKAKTKANKNN